jgi:hypothetical protein
MVFLFRFEASSSNPIVEGHPLTELFFSVCDKLPLGALVTLHYMPSVKRSMGDEKKTIYDTIITASSDLKKGLIFVSDFLFPIFFLNLNFYFFFLL